MEPGSHIVEKNKLTLQQVVDPVGTVLKCQCDVAHTEQTGFQATAYRGRGQYQGCRPGSRTRG